MSEKNEEIRSMADLLRSGATMTELSCPACSSPLFKLRSGELWCAKCQKRVVVVKEGEQPLHPAAHVLLGNLESTLLEKIQELSGRLHEEKDIERLSKLGEVLSKLLENVERVRKIERRRA
ncbi:MAG: Sjogren's syndrome/scleroderma autoantigen 1 family protein [Candidatus Bathyarchaeia archaeon]